MTFPRPSLLLASSLLLAAASVPPATATYDCSAAFVDTDGDGVLDVDEDTGGNDDCDDDDSDADGVPNYLDCRDAVTDPNLGVGQAENESMTNCMLDGDLDGWGDDSVTETGGLVAGIDCDDSSGDTYPFKLLTAADVEELGDNDCDGRNECWLDADFDGWGDDGSDDDATGVVVNETDEPDLCEDLGETPPDHPGDCDDSDETVHPTAPEIEDGIDNDCDGLVDADDPDFNLIFKDGFELGLGAWSDVAPPP